MNLMICSIVGCLKRLHPTTGTVSNRMTEKRARMLQRQYHKPRNSKAVAMNNAVPIAARIQPYLGIVTHFLSTSPNSLKLPTSILYAGF